MTEIVENFLTIAPRDNMYLDNMVDAIPLNVVRNNGVNYTPDLKITVNDLNDGTKRFINNTGKGDKFKVTVVIGKDDKFNLKELLGYQNITVDYVSKEVIKQENPFYDFRGAKANLITALDYWISNMTVFIVTTQAIDIPNGEYIVTKNDNRKQTLDNYTYWELEFTKYTGDNDITIKVDTTYTDKAIATYNNNKSKTKTTTKTKATTKTKKASTTNNKFSKCQLKVLVYSKTKKKVDCVVQLQNILKKKGYYKSTVDGWYYDKTLDAVKQFQKAYNKKQEKAKTVNIGSSGKGTSNKKNLIIKLPENGKINKDTFNALCKV